MSEPAAAFPLPSRAPSHTPEREALLNADRLSSLGELVRGLAHEVNNPLFGMLGLVELLLTETEPGTKAHERLLLVQQSGLQIREIMQTLLDFARGEPDVERCLTLQEVAAGAVALVRCTSAGKGLEIREQYCDGPLEVDGDATRLGQVFLSLLVNAKQALPSGGVVTVRLEREGPSALATVSDTGEGVDMSARLSMFEAFSTTKPTGTGIGLAAGLDIARAHGGDLTVVPSVEGAELQLRLPLADGGA